MKAQIPTLPVPFRKLAELDREVAELLACHRDEFLSVAADQCRRIGFDSSEAPYVLYTAIFLRVLPNRQHRRCLRNDVCTAITCELLDWHSRRNDGGH